MTDPKARHGIAFDVDSLNAYEAGCFGYEWPRKDMSNTDKALHLARFAAEKADLDPDGPYEVVPRLSDGKIEVWHLGGE